MRAIYTLALLGHIEAARGREQEEGGGLRLPEPEIVGTPTERDDCAICNFEPPDPTLGVRGIRVVAHEVALGDGGRPQRAGRPRVVYSRRIEPGEKLVEVRFRKLSDLQWAKAEWWT